MEEEGWPSRRFKRWPMDEELSLQPGRSGLGRLAYQKNLGTLTSIFVDPALAEVIARLRDYCFQQGELNNANARDRLFFEDTLAHDLVFFRGDQDRPLIDDIPIDRKVYKGLEHLHASHLDLFELVEKSWTGRVLLRSPLSERELSLRQVTFRHPGEGHFIARARCYGRQYKLLGPRLPVAADLAAEIAEEFERELGAHRSRFSRLNRVSLLKVAGYHLYESAAGRLLRRHLGERLPKGLVMRPLIERYKLSSRADFPAFEGLPEVSVEERTPSGRPTLLLAKLGHWPGTPSSLEELMVVVDGREVLVLGFLDEDEQLRRSIAALMPKGSTCERGPLSAQAFYRALRHLHSD
jgi:hypothetical protein